MHLPPSVILRNSRFLSQCSICVFCLKLTTQIIIFQIASTINTLFFKYAYAERLYCEVENEIYVCQSSED
jgi:hypothetical protein